MNKFLGVIFSALTLGLSTAAVADNLNLSYDRGNLTDNDFTVTYQHSVSPTYNLMASGELDDYGVNQLDKRVFIGVHQHQEMFWGFTEEVYTGLGGDFYKNTQNLTWFSGSSLSHSLYGPVSVTVSYRHLQAVNDVSFVHENRYGGALYYRLNHNDLFGLQYYKVMGTNARDEVGVSLTHSF